MSETLYGIELGTLRQAISAHELQGYENLGPYIFTKVSNKKVGESSSGFGPGQITATTAEDMLRRYPSLFADEGFKTYVNKFIVQGTNKLNIDYYNSLYKDRRRQRTTKNDRQIFGPLGKGNISEEDHNKYYTKLFNIVIRDKAKNADNLDSFLKNYHGAGEGKEQQNIDYSKSVRQKLKDLGISISGASDPKQFQGERVTPLPEPKPEKPKMAMPVPKPERVGDQFIDQQGEIADTGEGPDMDDKSTYEKVKPYIPFLRHLNEGGMTLAKQMELFDEGGLKDEGGTTDPISGNEVPSGSLQEEVRDDIPAQLSEGEFVFPADVVRYIGLEKLMQMRQEAKMGLAMMERMGQMGNSEEAVMPDDIPFELSDLDITDDPVEMQEGGMVPGQGFPSIPPGIPTPREQVNNQQFGIAGTQQSAFAGGVGGFIPYEMPQFGQTPMPQAYAPPVQQFVPTQTAPTPLPTPEQFLPQTPTDPTVTTEEYINPETGERRVFTFVGGQPTVAIPDGFIPLQEYEAQQPPTTETPSPTVETTQVTERDDSDADERRRAEEEAKYGPGGGRIGLGGSLDPNRPGRKTGAQIVGVSFNTPGGLPGVGAVFGTAAGLASGEGIPQNTTATFFLDGRTVTVNADKYNRMKKAGFMGAESNQILKDVSGESAREAEEALKAIKFGEIRDAEGGIRRVSREEELKDTAEKAAKFTDAMKENDLVIDKETGAIVMKDGTSAQKQKDFMDYVAAMATDDDEDDEPSGTSYSLDSSGSSSSSSSSSSRSGSGSSYSGSDRPDRSDRHGGNYGAKFRAGGLGQKGKPKAKKMKRGGLASKK